MRDAQNGREAAQKQDAAHHKGNAGVVHAVCFLFDRLKGIDERLTGAEQHINKDAGHLRAGIVAVGENDRTAQQNGAEAGHNAGGDIVGGAVLVVIVRNLKFPHAKCSQRIKNVGNGHGQRQITTILHGADADDQHCNEPLAAQIKERANGVQQCILPNR